MHGDGQVLALEARQFLQEVAEIAPRIALDVLLFEIEKWALHFSFRAGAYGWQARGCMR
jgi:hypothetical protein